MAQEEWSLPVLTPTFPVTPTQIRSSLAVLEAPALSNISASAELSTTPASHFALELFVTSALGHVYIRRNERDVKTFRHSTPHLLGNHTAEQQVLNCFLLWTE
jgi:hypothetical protein